MIKSLLRRLHYLPKTISYRNLYSVSNSESENEVVGDEWEGQSGTDYSNWVLARSANANHDVSYLKRRYGRDRYNIHKLTNLDFMCSLVNR